MNSEFYIPARSADAPYIVDVTPQSAGWAESSLHVLDLGIDGSVTRSTGDEEVMILPLSGGGSVAAGDETFELSTRASVFDGPADMVYLGINQTYTLSGHGRIAICGARAGRSFPNRRVAAADVPVELRGAGNCSRQVHNFGTATTFEADSLIACEVITPGGNWSSYPSHKHDENTEFETQLEEIYYFEIKADEHGPGMAFHSTYGTPERPIDVALRVGTGDTALVPHGWHGPCVAAPGYDLYYLNVMAGPGGSEWLSVDDPCYGWLRQTWDDTDVDPRLPYAPNRLDA